MTRYHPLLVTLHWLMAIMILLALVAGSVLLEPVANSDPTKVDGLRNHMTLGIAILVLVLIRLITRYFTAKPPEAETGNTLLDKAGGAAHVTLYVLVLGMCGSGLALANAAGLPGIVFGGSGAPLPADFWEFSARTVHGIISNLLWALIAAHVAGFAYHQFILKDGLVKRMWFGNRRG